MSATAELVTGAASDRNAEAVVDLDTHVGVPFEDPAEWIPSLTPFLSDAWKRRIADGSISFLAGAWSNAWHFVEPGGGNRISAKTPEGLPARSDPAFVLSDHIEPNNIVANVIITHGGPAYLVQTPDACSALTAAFNDFHCERWLDFDPRFRLSISVPYRYPAAAVAEIERLADRPGVVAVYLQPSDQPFASPFYEPILAAANDLEITIFTHPGSDHMYGDGQMAGGYADSAFDRYIGWNDVGSANVAKLVLGGVFERFPKLKFVFAEYGWVWLAPLMRRMDDMWQRAPEQFPALRKAPSAYVLDHIRVTSQPALEVPSVAYENLMLEQIHAERVMCFSSDYPHWDGDDPKQIFKGITPELRRRIFFDNAVETIGPRLLGSA
jgi:predicted TIM-barrel fold metal-dependent hydrolase